MTFIQIFDVLWLTIVLALLFLIWRSSERNQKQNKEALATLFRAIIDVAQKDADSVRQSVQALQELITLFNKEK